MCLFNNDLELVASSWLKSGKQCKLFRKILKKYLKNTDKDLEYFEQLKATITAAIVIEQADSPYKY